MNDCVLSYICICDNPQSCYNCKNYLSMSSSKGEEIIKEYGDKAEVIITEALSPLRKEYKEKLMHN